MGQREGEATYGEDVIVIKLSTGEEASVNNGVWLVEGNAELTRFFNTSAMQPPAFSDYAPSPDARMAMYALKVWGGEWVSSDEPHAGPGKIY